MISVISHIPKLKSTNKMCYELYYSIIHNYCSRRVEKLNDPNLYSKDYANCCHNRSVTVTRKRKLSGCDDKDFNIHEELTKTAKVHKNSVSGNGSATEETLWKPEGEEEEVVCAPDLSLLMGEDDDPEIAPETPAPETPAPSKHVPVNSIRFVSPINQAISKPIILQRPSIKTRPVIYPRASMILNPAAASNVSGVIPFLPSLTPLPSQSMSITTSADAAGPKLLPGLKHEWFDSAARATAKVHTKLSYEISVLSTSQNTASTIEELAKVHNKLQEVLSTSINSLIQVRRNLRSEFLTGLNKLRFSKSNVQLGTTRNVVTPGLSVVKKQTLVSVPVTETIDLVGGSQSEEKADKPKMYLKVRTIDQLSNIPPECITIPDDGEKEREPTASAVIEKEKAETTPDNTKTDSNTNITEICDTLNNSDSNKENLENFSTNKETSEKTVAQEESEPITHEIKRALFESKMEQIVNNNLQYNCKGISAEDLKRMLSARVYVNFKSKKRPREKDQIVMEDFEEMLNGSVVIKHP